MIATFIRGFAGIWAGVVVGGVLIAAPTEFRIGSLSLPLLLEIGRVQFYWVGTGEAFLCSALLFATALFERPRLVYLALPVGLIAIQRLYLMPFLDASCLRRA